MAVLLLLLAVAGGALVGDLVLENTASGTVTVLDRSFTGFSQGQLLAAAAGLGLVVGVLAAAALGLRRSRRVRRKELRQAEQDLSAEVEELERENRALRDQLAHRDRQARRPGTAMPVDRSPEPVYEEARRVARLRASDPDR